jgi:hypothetical protein
LTLRRPASGWRSDYNHRQGWWIEGFGSRRLAFGRSFLDCLNIRAPAVAIWITKIPNMQQIHHEELTRDGNIRPLVGRHPRNNGPFSKCHQRLWQCHRARHCEVATHDSLNADCLVINPRWLPDEIKGVDLPSAHRLCSVELANAIEADHVGRLPIGVINMQFMAAGGSSAEIPQRRLPPLSPMAG